MSSDTAARRSRNSSPLASAWTMVGPMCRAVFLSTAPLAPAINAGANWSFGPPTASTALIGIRSRMVLMISVASP